MLDMSEKSITAYAKAVTKGSDVGKFGGNSAKRKPHACGVRKKVKVLCFGKAVCVEKVNAVEDCVRPLFGRGGQLMSTP